MAKKSKTQDDVDPDAWDRFERAVDVVAKSPPQHRIGPKTKRNKPRKKQGKTDEQKD